MTKEEVDVVLSKYKANFGRHTIPQDEEPLWRAWLSIQDLQPVDRALDQLISKWDGEYIHVPKIGHLKKVARELRQQPKTGTASGQCWIPAEDAPTFDQTRIDSAIAYILESKERYAAFLVYLKALPLFPACIRAGWERDGWSNTWVRAIAFNWASNNKRKQGGQHATTTTSSPMEHTSRDSSSLPATYSRTTERAETWI